MMNRLKKYRNRLKTKFKQSRSFKIGSVFVAVIFLYLLGTSLYVSFTYADKVLPKTYVANVDVSGLKFDEANNRINEVLASSRISLVYKDQTENISAGELIQVNAETVKTDLSSSKPLDYIFPWFGRTDYELTAQVDEQKVAEVLAKYKDPDFIKPVNAKFTVKSGEVKITDGKDGVILDDKVLAAEINDYFNNNISNYSNDLKTTNRQPDVTVQDIESLSGDIKSRTALKIKIISDGQEIVPSEAEVSSWLIVSKLEPATLTVSNKEIKEYVDAVVATQNMPAVDEVTTSFTSGRAGQVTTAGADGRTVKNADEVAKVIFDAVDKQNSADASFEFEKVAYKKATNTVDDLKGTYTYDVAVWGNPGVDLASFKQQAAETLASANGWSRAGVSFAEVASGGTFTLVIASPDQVAAASSGCDSTYSCNVGRYVIINADRWKGATPAWNAAGGSLRDYRHMVVNHETGHWLGFGHRYCGGAGQLAPVMQQQSISLGGCKFNPWPTADEIASL